MGLFSVLSDLTLMPVRIALDVVTLPSNIMNGDNVLDCTKDGIDKIKEDLED